MIISFSYIDKYFNLIAPFYHKFYFTFFNLCMEHISVHKCYFQFN